MKILYLLSDSPGIITALNLGTSFQSFSCTHTFCMCLLFIIKQVWGNETNILGITF